MITEAEARRVRPFMSGVIALAVALVVAVGWYFLNRGDTSTRARRRTRWAASPAAPGSRSTLAARTASRAACTVAT